VETSTKRGDEDVDGGGVADAIQATGSNAALTNSRNNDNTEMDNTRTASSQNDKDLAVRFARRRSDITKQCIRYAVVLYITWIPMTVRAKGLRGQS
jgi:hypothetical protein